MGTTSRVSSLQKLRREGLDSESETENIVAWEHAQAHLELDEV
jgi:hypothetical protein